MVNIGTAHLSLPKFYTADRCYRRPIAISYAFWTNILLLQFTTRIMSPHNDALAVDDATIISIQQHMTQKAVGLCQPKTRKLCYRKDDRVMRPMYECPDSPETLKAEPILTARLSHSQLP